MLRKIFFVVAGCWLLAGCAYVGEPLPPSLNIPTRVSDLRVIQRGGKIVVEFTIPQLTTDGVTLSRLGSVELRAGAAGQGPFQVEKWAAAATPVETGATRPGAVKVEIPARDWVGREVIFGARVSGRKGRFSEWSELVVRKIVPALERPSGLAAQAVAAGVQLTWQAPREIPGLAFRVYRNDVEVARTAATPWVDTGTQYGKSYRYGVQSVLKTGETEAESEICESVAITPEDRFPPAAPVGLTAVAGVQSIELSWERNTEPDLKGYYVYRATEGRPFERVGELVETPSASDRSIESGRSYRYVVSAVDQLGNESARSAAVEIAAP